MQCPKCGYQPTDYEHQKSKDQCPECGIYYAKFVAQQKRFESLGVTPTNQQQAQAQRKVSSSKSGEVVIVDVRMPFWSMVVFMVKWAFAAIPAMIIIGVVITLLSGALGAFLSFGSSSSSKAKINVPETTLSDKTSTLPLSNTKTENAGSVESELIAVKLLNKGFDDEGYRSEITLKLSFENKTGRDIQAFEGILRLQDLLGNDVKNVRITINEAKWSGADLVWDGAMRFNKYKDDDQRFRSISGESLRTKFDVVKILYQDGELLEI